VVVVQSFDGEAPFGARLAKEAASPLPVDCHSVRLRFVGTELGSAPLVDLPLRQRCDEAPAPPQGAAPSRATR